MLSCHLIIEPDILARQLQDLVFLTLTTKIVFGQPTKECRVGESGVLFQKLQPKQDKCRKEITLVLKESLKIARVSRTVHNSMHM